MRAASEARFRRLVEQELAVLLPRRNTAYLLVERQRRLDGPRRCLRLNDLWLERRCVWMLLLPLFADLCEGKGKGKGKVDGEGEGAGG